MRALAKSCQTNYFGRLSNIDRKRWICEEYYCRENYGIQTISDQTFKKLCKTPGRKFKLANDPYTYEILSNLVYMNKF
jgi:hypothetical protein